MHIKKIEIEGFKSYARKQVVDKFDHQFNAITGLNGSGKSNILDSICFVLGITDLKCIRAENLNALVYKSGQAGVTKASVTITFDNTDKKSGPIGYQDYDEIIVRRQVIVNGRTSYTINGSAMTNNKVSDFFRSVGLNVNNPHFLIMQGRITKVLNMKPHEILGMVEEAAGTKMYDSKRQVALNTMEKKQSKVEEINQLLANEIKPKVSRLKEEKAQYLQYQKMERDIEQLKKLIDAFEYWQYLQEADRLDGEVVTTKEDIAKAEDKIEDFKNEEKKIEDYIADVEAKKASKNNGERGELEEALKAAKEILIEKEAARDEVSDSMTATQVELDRLSKSVESDRKELQMKQEELKKTEASLGGEEDEGNRAEETVKAAKAKLEALAKGLTTDDNGQAVTLEAQISATRTQLSEITTNVKAAEMRKAKIAPELTRKRKEMETLSKQNVQQNNQIKENENEVKKAQAALDKNGFDEAHDEGLRQRLPKLKTDYQEITKQINNITKADWRLEFNYRDPWPGFDRDAEVLGIFCQLFRLKDARYATAVETVLGSMLYHVVFAHQQTAAAFVDKNCMTQRRTIFPMDKLFKQEVKTLDTRVNYAKKICKDRGADMHMALDLIEYDPQFKDIMEYAFKAVIIVDDAKVASEIAFSKQISLRCVTIEGDDVRPGGTMAGGSYANNGPPILKTIAPLWELRPEQRRIVQEIEDIEQELQDAEPSRQRFMELRNTLEKASGRLEIIRENLKNSPMELLRGEIAEMEKELPKCEQTIKESQTKVKELTARVKELENRKKNEKAYQENAKKQYEKELKDAESTLKKLRGTFEKAKSTLNALRAQITGLEEQIAQQLEEIEKQRKALKELGENVHEGGKEVQNAQKVVDARQKDLNDFLAELKEKDSEIKKAQKKLDAMKKDTLKTKNEIDSLRRQLEKTQTDAVQCRKLAAHLKKSCKTIAEIEGSLGKDGDYSFKNFSKEKSEKDLEKMTAEREAIGKNLNPQAHHVLDTAESQVNDLILKTEQIDRDKKTLDQTIATLDTKKRKEILKAHEQVNRDFGNIFSTLLPGATAKLEPPAGKTALDGLEVKVAFNGKWKESLNELSGGQRSLVALSLVLAMLKFKPAPIYILDEVDSALDLSHTQNIGHMIKKHFTNSQFIIVSLKEGMFNHANVLYRTKFVDGTSQVTRTTNV